MALQGTDVIVIDSSGWLRVLPRRDRLRWMKTHLTGLRDTPPWDWPDGTGEMLLDVLRNDQATESELCLAAEFAGDFTVINDALAETLVSILRNADQSETVRSRAAISLGPALDHADTMGFEDPDDIPIAKHTFDGVQRSLYELYLDAGVPRPVRRGILEASVRAPQDWHQAAIAAAFASDDRDWRLTAVFCMRFVRGFDGQILEALESQDPETHYEAVLAAGNWATEAAWPHVVALVTSRTTDKSLLLAAIDAVAGIRPHEAPLILGDLTASGDDDIVAAVDEALAMAGGLTDVEEDELGDDPVLH